MSFSINTAYGRAAMGSAGGKMYVPVAHSALLYSHFDHVSGVPVRKGQSGVSISKIQILNTLIDHLSSIKVGKVPAALKSTSPEEINSLIDTYQTQIRQAVAASQHSLYGLAGSRPETGALFSFDA